MNFQSKEVRAEAEEPEWHVLLRALRGKRQDLEPLREIIEELREAAMAKVLPDPDARAALREARRTLLWLLAVVNGSEAD